MEDLDLTQNMELDQQMVTASSQYADVMALKLFVFFMTAIFLILLVWISRRYDINDFNVLLGREPLTRADFTPTQAVSPVKNPFIFRLVNEKESSMTKGITCSITCQEGCTVRAYWGVTIAEAYPIIYQQWQEYCGNFTTRSLLEDISLQTEEDRVIESGERVEILFKSPQPVDLGSPPRDRYPLVVVLMDIQSLDLQPGAYQIASVIAVLHVKDSVCPGESHIISQFVRTPHGQPYDLKHLYVSTDDNLGADYSGSSPNLPARETQSASTSDGTACAAGQSSTSFSRDSNQGEPADGSTNSPPTLCTVCMSSPVQIVILPCRHAIVCRTCFTKLQNCPMCRNYIYSFFTLDIVTDDRTGDNWNVNEWAT